MAEAISLTCTVNTPAIPATDSERLIYLLVEIEGKGDAGASLPTTLALVVDVSESMQIRVADDEQFRELARTGLLQEVLIDGVPAWQSTEIPDEVMARLPRKIDRVQEALRIAVQQLRPTDRFSLVAFAGQATSLIQNTAGDQKSRLHDVVNELDKLQLGDDTYIGRGIALGIEELKRGARPEIVNRLLVLTDGFTLDEADCRTWALRARQADIPISTMGLGGEFNEELMIPIADQTGGEAYLLENPNQIPSILAQELQRAQTINYRNLEIKLRPSQGIDVRAAYRVRPSIAPLASIDEGGSYSFPLGDLVAGEEPALLIELIVPPRPAGLYRLVQVLLACNDPAGGLAGSKIRQDVVVEYTTDLAQTTQQTPQVMQVVKALSTYKLQRGAQTNLESGDMNGATRKLRAAATRLLDMGEQDLAAEVEKQITELEQRGQVDSYLTKKLRYETRKLTQKLTDHAPAQEDSPPGVTE